MARRTLTDKEKKDRDAQRVTKFKDIGSKRLNNALTAINRIVPLGNRNQYSYTDEQVAAINKHLTDAVKRVNDAFAPGAKASSGGVEL